MEKKRYTINTSCPQCGCSAVSHLTKEEIIERFGNVSNVEMECSECALKYAADMKTACPEWDLECKTKD